MNQDHANMIMIGLLAVNTLLMIYCAYNCASEEFRVAGQKGQLANSGATEAKPAAPAAKPAAPAAGAAKAPGWAIGIPPRKR